MNRSLAAELARLSELAYEEPDTVRAALPSASVDLVDIDDTQAFLIAWPDRADIVFRGTQITSGWSWADIKTNLIQGKKPLPGRPDAKVHGGYLEAVMDALPAVRSFVAQQRARGVGIYFTGHSLGGVLATLAGSLIDVGATYTFGAPRCGNEAFAKLLEDRRVYRVVFGFDIAPSYPHRKLRYRHGGERWQLSRSGALQRGGNWRDRFHAPVATGILDHRVSNYVDGLKGPQH